MGNLRRLFALLFVLTLFTATVGCGGTSVTTADDGGSSGDAATDLALFAACTDNSQCMSGLCTQTSYDRSPTPICTYQCDASDQNPLCPMGCNPKGYCKKPN